MSKREFIETVAPIAVKLHKEGSPIFPSLRIAQALLETGGKIHSWNNLVGFKVGRGKPNTFWKGRSVSTKTWEVYDGVYHGDVTAHWRAYDCIEDCFRDQDRLFHSERYKRVLQARNPLEQAQALYECGYATDPMYPMKLAGIARGLSKYDVPEESEKEENTLELTKYQRDTLEQSLKSLLDRKVINDPSWLEKAKEGTLTVSELTWLNTVILANK